MLVECRLSRLESYNFERNKPRPRKKGLENRNGSMISLTERIPTESPRSHTALAAEDPERRSSKDISNVTRELKGRQLDFKKSDRCGESSKLAGEIKKKGKHLGSIRIGC